jgi:hypothetical protein
MNMFPLDTLTNAAVERQADQVRAVQAYGSRPSDARSADDGARPDRPAIRLTLALAAATPVLVVIAWALLPR